MVRREINGLIVDLKKDKSLKDRWSESTEEGVLYVVFVLTNCEFDFKKCGFI